ncbi:MAG: HlyD family efflux transporter periplasmic adaptor subunit [candidate division Zixibacteria bacterium]|nr:HlyD family efflux transporter periplasmic adaptor subunit [candidate division Zixibacteria bacterium]
MKGLLSKYGWLLIILILVSCGEDNSAPGGSGLIEATEVVISAKMTGHIERLFIGEGDIVQTDDTVAVIDTTTTRLKLNQAEALRSSAEVQLEISVINIDQIHLKLSLAKKEFDRVKNLIKTGSVNQQQYDKAETAYNQAILSKKQAEATKRSAEANIQKINAEIALLGRQLDDCFPLVPNKGIVSDKFIEIGELVNFGAPLIKIASLDTVSVKIYLPASDLTQIKIGDQAEIDPEDGASQPLAGQIVWISPKAEFTPKNVQTKEARANLVYAVKIAIPNSQQILKIGMPVSVKIL